jgi:arsenate reductase
MKKVLFVCVENAGRSQMAEAFGRAYGLETSSAGSVPAENVNPIVVQVLKKRGIALPGKPKMITEDMIKQADLVVTMGCSVQEVCPKPMVEQMEKKLVDWHIEDPKGKSVGEVEKIAGQIENKVIELLKKD